MDEIHAGKTLSQKQLRMKFEFWAFNIPYYLFLVVNTWNILFLMYLLTKGYHVVR
jgi:hypothetical protein